jgi:hypothetical protein
MRYSIPLCGLLAAVALGSDVHELNKENFKGFMEENDLVLAECELIASSCTPWSQLILCSLRTVVWPLQSFGTRVRDGCNDAQGEGDPSHQG